MRRLLLATPCLLAACDMPTGTPENKKYIFEMPMVHDMGREYLVCEDTLKRGTRCDFAGIRGYLDIAQDKIFLDAPDTTVFWPFHDGIGPVFVRRSY